MSTINNRLQIELTDGSIVVFHPESNTGQIYDFANGRWLDETIEEILNLLDNPEDTSALRTMLEEHIANSNIHVISTEKSKWNNHVDDTVAHMTSTDRTDLANAKAHVSNNNIHITSAEKTDIANAKTHTTDNTVHVTSAEKTDIANAKTHVANNDIHVTATQKTNWNGAVSHVGDSTVHVTSAQKTAWDNHVGNINFHFTVWEKEQFWNHLESDSTHVTYEDKYAWNEHMSNTSSHVSTTDRSNWNGKIGKTDYATTTIGGAVKVDGSTITINSSGVIKANVSPTFKAIHVYATSATSVPSGTATELPFNTTHLTTGHFTASSPRITVPSEVSYIRVTAEITLSDYFKTGSVYVRKNGVNNVRTGGFTVTYTGSSVIGSGTGYIVSPPIAVVQGDYISIWASHYMGTSSNFTLNNLSVEALG